MKKKFTVEGPIQGINVRCSRCNGLFQVKANLGALMTAGESRFEKSLALPMIIECPRCKYQGK